MAGTLCFVSSHAADRLQLYAQDDAARIRPSIARTQNTTDSQKQNMGAASSAKPIDGPKTPMELVASLKKFVEATEVNFDDAFCNREDIDAFIAAGLTPEAEEEAVEAVEANPEAGR